MTAELIEARAEGLAFEDAWARGIAAVTRGRWGRGRSAERQQWKVALDAAKAEYSAAYVGEPTPCARIVPLLVTALDDGSLAHEASRDRVAA